MSEKPDKTELPNELRRVLNTLTDDAQSTALKKFGDSGLDPNKGKIPLQETLINLSQTRDILLDAVETGKFIQLPLKIQYTLFDQVQAINRELTALAAGTDAVLNLETAVEDLTASAWQFQLHNLSGEVLGFQTKMNQLKSQETRVREVARRIDDFTALHDKAKHLSDEMAEQSRAMASEYTSATKVTEQLQTLLKESTNLNQKVSALAGQVEQYDKTAGQQLATANQAAAETEAIASKSKEMRVEIESARNSFQDLTTKTQQLLTQTETTASNQLSNFDSAYEKLRQTTETATTALDSKLDASIAETTAQTTTKLDSVTASADSRINQFVSDASARLTKAEATHESTFSDQLREFATKSDTALQTFIEKSNQSVSSGNEALMHLVTELNELEGRIRKAIERATGFTLFHAFQERQLQIVKSKKFWGWALAVCVAVSIGASGTFIYWYRDLQEVTLPFLLKLSISIPLIYAIAFCNLQYSRERKLEEEYAFKSSVSISLEPYQRLVDSLVDHSNKDELAKYTEFIIQSVNRVFTSPTEPIFEGSRRERTYTEKIIKAVGGAIGTATEPLIKGLKR